MANTFTLIEAKTLTTTTASIEFTSIPSTYTDLKIVASTRQSSTSTLVTMYFNTDTTNANYTVRRLFGSGSAASSSSYSAPYVLYSDISTYTASTFSNDEIYIPNYTGSNKKSFSVDSVNENNATAAESALTAGLWSGTSGADAINKITLTSNDLFVQYSSFYLYGIKNS
jgi:hypothetical protein